MPLYFDEFQPGDLLVDWPMILVGWRGFNRRKLSAEQVIAYALEQIGRGTPERDEIAALLASTDPSEWQTVDRYLEQLAETQHHDRQKALRKWRLAELRKLLQSFPRLDRTYEYPEDEPLRVFFGLADLWSDYNGLPDSVTAMPQSPGPVEEVLAEQRAWAEQEETSLRNNVEVAE